MHSHPMAQYQKRIFIFNDPYFRFVIFELYLSQFSNFGSFRVNLKTECLLVNLYIKKDAVDLKFAENVVSRSPEVTKGRIFLKG